MFTPTRTQYLALGKTRRDMIRQTAKHGAVVAVPSEPVDVQITHATSAKSISLAN